MAHVLRYVRDRYGSIDGYLDDIGFDAKRRMTLAAALCK